MNERQKYFTMMMIFTFCFFMSVFFIYSVTTFATAMYCLLVGVLGCVIGVMMMQIFGESND